MDEPLSRLECVECGARYPAAAAARYLCDCGGLLDVVHDLDRLRERHPHLPVVFDARRLERSPLDRSGVWRYREVILPDLPEDAVVTMGEGNTGLYDGAGLAEEIGMGAGRLLLKHEGENPTLSFKDRGMTAGVSWGRHLGARVGICASTGDTSASMAAYTARAPDMRGVVLLPAGKVTDEQLAQATCLGARTLALETDFDGCMRVVRELARSPEVYLLNSMNPFRIEGQKAIGLEVLHELGWEPPDWIVIPVGNAGNVSALGKGLREALALGLIDRLPRIAGAQAAAADPFFRSFEAGFGRRVRLVAEPTAASAIRIGDPVSYPKARRAIEGPPRGAVVSVPEGELLDAQALLGRAGIQACPNSGVAVAGLRRLLSDGVIRRDEKVVVILTAHGAKFSAVSLAYHRSEIEGITPSWANPPERLPADARSVAEALGIEAG